MDKCGCIESIKEAMLKQHNIDATIPVEYVSGRTYTEITYPIKNASLSTKKAFGKRLIFHKYCPFCGKPYEQEVSE